MILVTGATQAAVVGSFIASILPKTRQREVFVEMVGPDIYCTAAAYLSQPP